MKLIKRKFRQYCWCCLGTGKIGRCKCRTCKGSGIYKENSYIFILRNKKGKEFAIDSDNIGWTMKTRKKTEYLIHINCDCASYNIHRKRLPRFPFYIIRCKLCGKKLGIMEWKIDEQLPTNLGGKKWNQ